MSEQPNKFVEGMTKLGAFAGFLWGASLGVNDPELGFWGGAIGGTLMGAVGGWVAAAVLEGIARLAVGLLFIALILLRLKGILDFFAS
jgi:hypothetical protein